MSLDTIGLEILLNARASGLSAFKEMEAASGSTKNALGEFGKAAGAVGLIAGGALVAGLGYSVKAAADFQTQLMMLHTQAGMSIKDMNAVSDAALRMGPALGVDPTTFVEGFYHIASAASNLAPSLRNVNSELDIYQNAVKLSKIGNADLESSTQAMIGVMAAYGDSGMTATQAAAQLNEIVGAGDMRMQKLAAAMATGLLPAAKNFGISLRDVGAGLATLTDNVTPADEAATRMRMTFSLMAAPSGVAIKHLREIGMSSLAMGEDLRKPKGLLVAMQDLHSHLLQTFGPDSLKGVGEYSAILKDKGVDAADAYAQAAGGAAAAVSRIFGGGRSSAAIMTWLGEMDSLSGKYDVIKAGAEATAQFNDDWAGTQETLNFKIQQFQAQLSAAAIVVGNVLLPPLTRMFDWVNGVGIPAFEGFVKSIGGIEPILWGATAAVGALLMAALPVSAPVLGLAAALGTLAAAGAVLGAHFGPQLMQGGLSGLAKGVAGFLGVGASIGTMRAPTLADRTRNEAVDMAGGFGSPIGRQVGQAVTSFLGPDPASMAKSADLMKQMTAAVDDFQKAFSIVQQDIAKGKDLWTALQDALVGIGVKSRDAGVLVQGFHQIWDAGRTLLQGVLSFIQGMLQWIAGPGSAFIRSFAQEHKQDFEQIWTTVSTIMMLLAQIISAVLALILSWWRAHGEQVLAFIRPFLGFLVDLIKGALQLIQDVLKVILDAIHGNWKAFWEDLLQLVVHLAQNLNKLFDDLGPILLATLKGAFQLLLGLGDWLNNTFNALGQGLIDAIVDGIKWAGGRIMTALKEVLPGGANGPVADALKAAGVPGFAAGGIVTGPTLALIGESGPEAVVPLGRSFGSASLGAGTTVNVTIDLKGAVISDDAGIRKLSEQIGQYIYGQMQLAGAGWH